MISDGVYVDGSWELSVYVDDAQHDVKIRVKGDLHIGGAMHQLVEVLEIKQDWSDHAFWWPDRNTWLTRTRTTFDQYGVQSDSKLNFMRMHNNVQFLLPSLVSAVVRVNFANSVFNVVVRICKEINIRHPEELSLMFPMKKVDLKQNNPLPVIRRRYQQPSGAKDPNTPETPGPFSPLMTPGYLDAPLSAMPRSAAPGASSSGSHLSVPTPFGKPSGGSSSNLLATHSTNSLYIDGADENRYAECAHIPVRNVLGDEWVIKPKNLVQKTRLNATWLDSARSLMEQGIRPMSSSLDGTASSAAPVINLRFKFYNFYDLNTKYDAVRIHQLYEQARWTLLAEQLECTEDEMVVFAALQMQAELQTENPQTPSTEQTDGKAVEPPKPEDEVDDMLAELEASCLGKEQTNGDAVEGNTTVVPELKNYLKISKENILGMKSYKKVWAIIRESKLFFYKSHEDTSTPLDEFSLRGSEPVADVNMSTDKFSVRLSVFTADGSKEEHIIKFSCRDEYARWIAALKLISRGKTLASTTVYDKEVENILEALKLQTPGPQPVLSDSEVSTRLRELSDYVSDRILKKTKSKDHLRQRIAEAHSNVRDLNLLNAKLKYITSWQALTGYGITHFIVRFDKQKKDEIIGIAHNRIMLLHHSSGDTAKTWHFSEMRSWNVNWDLEKIVLEFKGEKVTFTPLSANCKTVIEFIGGYIFLGQRTPEKNQDLDVNLFHRLTCVTNTTS